MEADARRGVVIERLYSGSRFMKSLILCAGPGWSLMWLGHVSSSSMGVRKW